jgi:hypothetical protein
VRYYTTLDPAITLDLTNIREFGSASHCVRPYPNAR